MAEATVNSDGQRSDVDPSFTHHYYNPRHYEQGAMILTFCHGFFCQAQFFPVHNVQFVKYDVTVSFMAQVLDTVTYLVPQVLDTAS